MVAKSKGKNNRKQGNSAERYKNPKAQQVNSVVETPAGKASSGSRFESLVVEEAEDGLVKDTEASTDISNTIDPREALDDQGGTQYLPTPMLVDPPQQTGLVDVPIKQGMALSTKSQNVKVVPSTAMHASKGVTKKSQMKTTVDQKGLKKNGKGTSTSENLVNRTGVVPGGKENREEATLVGVKQSCTISLPGDHDTALMGEGGFKTPSTGS
ncbi:unnamed protein product [Linum trigynum]